MRHNVLRVLSTTELVILLAEDHVIRVLLAGMGFVTRTRLALTVVGSAKLVPPCAQMVSRMATKKA